MQNNLSSKIIATVAYCDTLDYPMTAFEIWKYLTDVRGQETGKGEEGKTTLLDVLEGLEKGEVKKVVEDHLGFYFLRGRQELVGQRLERNKISERKFKIAKRVIFCLKFVPFVRMAALTGRMAMKNTEEKSDIDLLIVLKHGHIYTGRTLVTLLIHILGKRRYGNHIANRICLNFFITDKSLEITLQDLFSAQEYSFIMPVFGYRTFHNFQKSNCWIRNFKKNFEPDEVVNLKMTDDSFFSRQIRKTGEMIFGFGIMEKYLKKWQKRRIENDPRTHGAGSMVMASDDYLIFLPKPQGPEIFENFQAKLRELKIA